MSHIEVQCNKCERTHRIDQKDFEFEQVDADERQMGAEITFEGSVEIQCECGNSIEVTHRYWEYPVGVENYKETDVAGATVVSNTL